MNPGASSSTNVRSCFPIPEGHLSAFLSLSLLTETNSYVSLSNALVSRGTASCSVLFVVVFDVCFIALGRKLVSGFSSWVTLLLVVLPELRLFFLCILSILPVLVLPQMSERTIAVSSLVSVIV